MANCNHQTLFRLSHLKRMLVQPKPSTIFNCVILTSYTTSSLNKIDIFILSYCVSQPRTKKFKQSYLSYMDKRSTQKFKVFNVISVNFQIKFVFFLRMYTNFNFDHSIRLYCGQLKVVRISMFGYFLSSVTHPSL